MKKFFAASLVIFSNISSMNQEYPNLSTNLSIAMLTPPPVLSPCEMEQAKRLAIKIVNELLSKKDKIITYEKLLITAKEIIDSNLQKLDPQKPVNWQLKEQVKKFVEKLNQKFYKNFKRHRELTGTPEFCGPRLTIKKELKRTDRFWDKLKIDINKNMQKDNLKNLRKLQLKVKQTVFIHSSYDNTLKRALLFYGLVYLQAVIIMASELVWIAYDQSDDHTAPLIAIAVSYIAEIVFIGIVTGMITFDWAINCDLYWLLEDINDRITNYPDADIFDETDGPRIVELQE